jgi:hypothetical protein
METRGAALRQKLTDSRNSLREVVEKIGSDDWDVNRADPQHWPPRDILAHLLSAEQGLRGRITRILDAADTAPPAGFDLATWNDRQIRKLRNRTVSEILEEMEAERQTTLQSLAETASSDLDLPGHRASGASTTVAGLFELIADHENQHAGEIAAAAGVE